MITFFRKIRKGLVSDNKFSKYLIYAIGEIVLVVIGILIALQLNDLKERKNEKQQAIEFHQRLADELDTKVQFFKSDGERALRIATSIKHSVSLLKKKEFSETVRDTLNYTLGVYFQFVKSQGTLKTFQEMESTGKLGLIYNNDLKKNTLNYIYDLESVSEIYSNIADITSDTDFIDKHVTLLGSDDIKTYSYAYNFEDLANDRFFINRIARIAYHWETKSYFSNKLFKESINLKEQYLEELNNLKNH